MNGRSRKHTHARTHTHTRTHPSLTHRQYTQSHTDACHESRFNKCTGRTVDVQFASGMLFMQLQVMQSIELRVYEL